MEAINAKVSQINDLKGQVETAIKELDGLIHDKFLSANNMKVDSQFVHGGKTIGETFVKDGQVKGYFLKKDGTLAKTFINITVDKNYKIVR